jgi:NAD(P)-dependent dehydrogenase (short-subunit alcohol dehydrogenase family)
VDLEGQVAVVTGGAKLQGIGHAVALGLAREGADIVVSGRERDAVDASVAARISRDIPLGRPGRAEDIAVAVLFFCLPKTELTTGQSLLVDGGHVAYLPEG